jgi:hypothetical protein
MHIDGESSLSPEDENAKAMMGLVEGFIDAVETMADEQIQMVHAQLELIEQLARGERPTPEALALKRQVLEEHLRILVENRQQPAQVRAALRLRK